MPTHRLKSAICDANILIDYVLVDEDLIREASLYWKEFYTTDIVLHEVTQLTPVRAEELGMRILPTSFAEIESPAPGLSLQDASCLYFASKLPAICVTNDIALRKACRKMGVKVVWGLEMILRLITEKQITKNRGKDVASKIHAINPVITKNIYSDFLKKWNDI